MIIITETPETLRVILDEGATNLLANAFIWKSTPHGFDYWASVAGRPLSPEAIDYLEETYAASKKCVHRVPSKHGITNPMDFAETLPGEAIVIHEVGGDGVFCFSDPHSAITFKLKYG